jgi:hypothetical protein
MRPDMGLDAEVFTDPEKAADRLRWGGRVDYQPGDGTRYDLMLVERVNYTPRHRFLLFANPSFGGATLSLDRDIDAIAYALSLAPVGSWEAIRPLLVALGVCQDGEPVYAKGRDSRREADLRAHNYDGEPLNAKDARLGRQVRRLVEEET